MGSGVRRRGPEEHHQQHRCFVGCTSGCPRDPSQPKHLEQNPLPSAVVWDEGGA